MQLDPTHTKMLRLQYQRQLTRLFKNFKRSVLNRLPNMIEFTSMVNRSFGTDIDDWLQYEMEFNILEPSKAITNNNIKRAYMKGKTNSQSQLHAFNIDVGNNMNPADWEAFVILNDINFNRITDCTTVMKNAITYSTNIGIMEGWGMNKIAKEITKNIQGNNSMGIVRARTIARTEVINAYNNAAVRNYRSAGLKADEMIWITSFDDRTCEECAGYDSLPISRTGKIPPAHPNCYLEGTELLTNDGWMEFKDLMGNEEILSFNPENEELEWLPYINYFKYKYTGETFNLFNKWFSLAITPNHNMVYGMRNHKDRKHITWNIKPLDVVKDFYDFYIPRTGKWNGFPHTDVLIDDLLFNAKDFCNFMGYYLSEGSTTKRSDNSYQISIHQNQPNKDKIYDDIKDIPVKVNNKSKNKIYINNTKLGKYLLQFGKSHEKYVPEIIKDMTADLIEVFLNAYCLGDGSIKTTYWKEKDFKSNDKIFFTSSKRMADDIGELIIKTGGYPSYKLTKNKGKKQQFSNGLYTIKTDIWRIRWNHSKKACKKHMNIQTTNYDGMVYDIELPRNHAFFVRYNGKVCVSGNCRCSIAPNPKEYPR